MIFAATASSQLLSSQASHAFAEVMRERNRSSGYVTLLGQPTPPFIPTKMTCTPPDTPPRVWYVPFVDREKKKGPQDCLVVG